MFKKKNRNVKTLPLNTFLPSRFPSPKESFDRAASCLENQDIYCFGEPVPVLKSPSSYALYYENVYSRNCESTIENISSGVKNLSFKSSSSSAGWSDEYETESSKKIQDELEQVDRILCGCEAVPKKYDENELKEWMIYFPNLRIFGTSVKINPIEKELDADTDEEVLAVDPDPICSAEEEYEYNSTSKSENLDKNVLKTTVINAIYDNVRNRLIGKNNIKENPKTTQRIRASKVNQKNSKRNDNPVAAIEINEYLKISPIPQRKSYKLVNKWSEPDPSTRSLINSQISSAKWLKLDSPEYNSLPFLTDNYMPKNSYTPYSGKRKSNIPKKRNKHLLVLPPIESQKLLQNNQFRSISATPGNKNYKCLSAISMQLDNELGNKRLVDVSKYLSNQTTVKGRTSKIPRLYKRWDSIDD